MNLFSLGDRNPEKERKERIKRVETDTLILKKVRSLLRRWEENAPDLPLRLDYAWFYFTKRPIEWALGESDSILNGFPKALVIDFEIPAWGLSAEHQHKYGIFGSDLRDKEQPAILADIMSALGCIFGDGIPEWKQKDFETDRLPGTVYYGVANIEGYRFIIKLDAPWPPNGCEVETKRTWSKKTTLKCASVSI